MEELSLATVLEYPAYCPERRRVRSQPVPLAQRPRRSNPWHHIEAIEFATLEWVDWFNNWQVLTSIGDVPPTEYEQQYYLTQEAPFTVASVN